MVLKDEVTAEQRQTQHRLSSLHSADDQPCHGLSVKADFGLMAGMVKLSDIADRAGVSTYTVSCALRGQGRVAEETAERIRRLALEMGYQPNAAARALAEGRLRSHGEVRDLAIAAIRFGAKKGRGNPLVALENQQMVTAAKAKGYSLEIVWWSDFESGSHLSRVLWARGVVGVILLTTMAPIGWRMRDLGGFEWERFSLVKISRGVDDLRCHCVRASSFFETKSALERIVAAGYRRIGVVLLKRSASEEDDFGRMGAVLAFQSLHLPRSHKLHLLRTIGPLDGLPLEVDKWLQKVKPEVVLGFPVAWLAYMELAGYRVPEDFAFVGLPVRTNTESQSGVATSGPLEDFSGRTFPAAMEMLHGEIVSVRRGLPIHPYVHLLPQAWQEGVTMPQKK